MTRSHAIFILFGIFCLEIGAAYSHEDGKLKLVATGLNKSPCVETARTSGQDGRTAKWSCDLGNGHSMTVLADDGRMKLDIVNVSNTTTIYEGQWSSGFTQFMPPLSLYDDPTSDSWAVTFLRWDKELSLTAIRVEQDLSCVRSGFGLIREVFLNSLMSPCDEVFEAENPVVVTQIEGKTRYSYMSEVSDETCTSKNFVETGYDEPDKICPGVAGLTLRISSLDGRDSVTITGPDLIVPKNQSSEKQIHDVTMELGYVTMSKVAGTVEWIMEAPATSGDVGVLGVIIPFKTRLSEASGSVAQSPDVELFDVHTYDPPQKFKRLGIFESRRAALAAI